MPSTISDAVLLDSAVMILRDWLAAMEEDSQAQAELAKERTTQFIEEIERRAGAGSSLSLSHMRAVSVPDGGKLLSAIENEADHGRLDEGTARQTAKAA